MDPLILLVLAALLIRVGTLLYVAGLSRAKNSAGAVARLVSDLGVAVLAFFLVGAALVSQTHNGFLGVSFKHFYSREISQVIPLFMVLSLVATGVVAGAVAERSRFVVVLACSAALAGVVVPLLGFWSQVGWLGRLKFADAGGASWLHVAGGIFALFAARAVGPRENKYHRDGSASVIPGHSIPAAGAGAMLIATGLIAIGSTGGFGLAALNATLGVAAGVVAALALSHLRYGKPDVLLILAGLLGSAVAMTAAAGVVAPIFALLIGAVAGTIVPLAAVEIDLRLHLDDPAGSIAIHLVGGAWGTLAAGLFHADRTVGQWLQGIGVQVLGLLVVAVVAGGVAFFVFKLLKGQTRSSESDEFDGLDLAEHDIGAYPDFQQNSIRSYHLREA